MTEQHSDSLTATGRYRAWVGEQQTGPQVPLRHAPRPWPGRTPNGNTRHSAITKNLSHFTNYKSWADKVKSGWQKDKDSNKDKSE